MSEHALHLGWRAPVAAAATLGAVMGMLPGAFLMTTLLDPLPTLVTGPVLFLNAAVLSALLAAWTANLLPDSPGRSRFRPLVSVAVGTAALVASLWVALIASGLWSRTFPFSPYAGLLGFGLFIGASTSFAAGIYREDAEPDSLDAMASVLLSAVPPTLLVLMLQAACAVEMCA